MGVVDRLRALLPARRAEVTGVERSEPTIDLPARRPGAGYMRDGRHLTFAGWNPALRDQDREIAESWDRAAARAYDLVHNSGWLAGAIDQAVANTVGTGLRLKAAPENNQFGMSDAEAQAWAQLVEQRWQLWSRRAIECDVEGRRSFGQMQAAALRTYFATGEIFAEFPWRLRPGGQYGTKVRLVPPHRISRRSDELRRVVSGVRMDRDGFPLAYIAVRRDRLIGAEQEIEVPARDRLGRPRVVHVFDGMLGTVRGITPMVPALKVAKQFDQLADATLMAAIVQSLFAASITGDAPTEEALSALFTPQEQAQLAASGQSLFDAWFDAQAGWYDSATINVGVNGRIAHLFPGQELKFHNPTHSGVDYRAYALTLLREIARCLGLTYESATGDYTGATYSSVRMATSEIFLITLYRREHIVAPFCQAAYEAWLEEEIDRGAIPFPGGLAGFLANRAAAARAEWRGTPKPQADDEKIARAHERWANLGVITDEMIAQDLGADIEDVYMQRAREQAMRGQLGLPEPVRGPAPRGAGGEDGRERDGGGGDAD